MDKKISGGQFNRKKVEVDKAYTAARDKAPRKTDEKRTSSESTKSAMPSGTLRKPNGERPMSDAGNKVRFMPGAETSLEIRTHLGEILDAPADQVRCRGSSMRNWERNAVTS